jgi:hypothetical protein
MGKKGVTDSWHHGILNDLKLNWDDLRFLKVGLPPNHPFSIRI